MIPFHVANLPKPQIVYGIAPDNSNAAFVHASVPIEFSRYAAKDFVEPRSMVENLVPVKPKSLESTPFAYIDTVDGLKMLRSKLGQVNEFAVDLEANMYRSFLGMTCLIQISTRTEDFVVDTLKLHKSIGHYLGRFFLDPTKKKVMHGSANDILWLQRDFGIYVCNLFDTMQASRILKLERNSLEFLLIYFCGVVANKQYQTSDWRLRPLPHEMLHYAREDTHHLLFIYDAMRRRLVSPTPKFEYPLLEVYERTQKICTTLYEKELYTESSYKTIFGLNEAGLDMEQLKAVKRLYQWRDHVARENDESSGYVMPNKLLLELSYKMPKTLSQIMAIIAKHNYPNHPFVLEKTDELLKIIQESNVKAAKMQPTHQGYYYVTPQYPPEYYVKVACQPRFYAEAKYPVVMMQSNYCTYPNYYHNAYVIC